MSIPSTKEELLNAIEVNYAKLKIDLENISKINASLKQLEGHSKNSLMSVNNLIAYLIGWGQLVLKWNEKKQNGLEVDFPETGYKWNELGKLAQKFYDDFENDDFEILCSKLDRTISEIIVLINQKSNAELYEINWYEKWTLGRLIQLNTASPYKNASQRIRKWKKGNK